MQFKHLFLTITFLSNLLLAGFAQEPILLEHGGGVRTVEFSPVDASLVASAGESNLIKLWNLQNDTVMTLRGHTGIVNSIAFSPNGELLASVSDDRTIKLWNVRNQQNIATLQEGTQFRTVAFSPDGQLLATGGWMHVKLWDVRRRVVIGTLLHDQQVQTVAFSSDGEFLAVGDASREGAGTVKVWNVQNQQVIATLKDDLVVVRSVTFSSDDRYLASSHYNGEVKVWNVSDWELLRTMPAGDYDTAFSPDGKMIVGTSDGHVNLWWVEDGIRVAQLTGPTGWRHHVDFSHDGTSLAVGAQDGFVRLYNIEDIEEDIEIRLQALRQPERVRLIYFLPSDRPVRPDRVTAFLQLVKDTQQFYASEMERHGFGRKTFRVETDKDGEPFVHHVDGNFEDAYYRKRTSDKVWKEITQRFDVPKDLYVCAIDISSERINYRINDDTCGEGSTVWRDGGQEIIIPASGHCFNVGVLAHELGHGFGLAHDFRNDAHVMSYGALRNELSSCAAEWLDASPFFNTDQNPFNMPFQVDKDITVKMLPPIEIPPNGVRLRFEVNDSDGLHQAQLHIPTTDRDPVEGSGFKLHSCRSLSGEVSTLEFITTELPKEDAFARLRVMDVKGNFKWWEHYFPIQATDILPKSTNRVGAVDTAKMTSETLQKVSGDDQRGDPNKRLAHPFVVAVRDANNEPVAGVQVTFRITVGEGSLSVANPWTDSNGHAQTFLTLGSSRINRVEVSISGVSERVTFSTDSEPQVLIAQSQRPPMYWIDTRAGTLHRLVGTKVETLVPSVQNATSFAVDVTGGSLYWTEKTSGSTGKIRRAYLDGTNVQLVKNLTSVPHSVAIDTTNDKLYLTNAWGKIQRINFDGSNFEPNLITGLDAPKHLALDVAGGKLYWTETAGRIRRANLNGSNLETLATDLGVLNGLAIANGKLYWTEQTGESAGKVQCANLDGSNIQTLSSLQSAPLGIAVDATGRKLYWTNSRGKIQRSDLNGSNIQNLVDDLGSPASITLGIAQDDVVVAETSLEKITGPWLWVIAPTTPGQGGANSTNVDSLAEVSNGAVTESDVATKGTVEGDSVGDLVWTLGDISPTGGNNVTDLINKIGLGRGDVNDHSSYAFITLESATAQSDVTMVAGSDDAIKIWLNGEVVHNNPIDREAVDFQDTFKVDLNKGDNLLLVKVGERGGWWSMFVGIDADVNAVYKRPPDPVASVDVNGDGIVNILDLVLISANFGKTGQNPADVNNDGVVNIVDLVKVASEMGAGAAAPSAHSQTLEMLSAADVKQWLIQAQHANLADATSQRGILMLQQLLAALVPKETSLLPNYPNPFNPETWIPYQLSETTEVTLHIYAVDGTLIRTLALGYQPAGMYQSKNRAVYWDGRNKGGEPVASGVYFYTITAGNFTATRKMLIRK